MVWLGGEEFADKGKVGEVDATVDVENKEEFGFGFVVFGGGGVGEKGIFEGNGKSVGDDLGNSARNASNKSFDALCHWGCCRWG